tara:strand:- start:183 stop:614 length:432 start_codon:yes stop_codon:yes gene_type:complete
MVFGKVKEGIGAAKDMTADAAAAVTEKGKEQMNKQVPAMLEKLADLKLVLKESGFIVGDVAMTLSIPPSLSLTVTQVEGAENRINEVIETHELTKLQKSTLVSVSQLYAFNQTFGKYDYVMGQIDIGLSIPPAVTVHLSSKDG